MSLLHLPLLHAWTKSNCRPNLNDFKLVPALVSAEHPRDRFEHLMRGMHARVAAPRLHASTRREESFTRHQYQLPPSLRIVEFRYPSLIET